ncbi:hypothetical protein ABMA28_016758 [Loxostege sticticalis]|uniref:Uncharacterized protein n=1 Tax=Loxostege sticticalis TaxID=481309 RepID=A0ABD0T5Q7_LOXSC
MKQCFIAHMKEKIRKPYIFSYIQVCTEPSVREILTFFLACWMSCVICIGLAAASAAGIAYGYNYQMAEWLTFTRSDVTVYMRRGQFYDRPDVEPRYISRRTGGEEDDGVAGDQIAGDRRNSPDYDAKALPASWSGVRGAENLVEKLHKYQPEELSKVIAQDSAADPTPPDYYKLTSSRLVTKLISITPNVVLSTAIWKSGDSKIIMRNFQMSTMKDLETDSYTGYPSEYVDRDEMLDIKYNKGKNPLPKQQQVTRTRIFLTPDLRIREEGAKSSTMVMRHWGKSTTPIFQDYSDEESLQGYEDNIVYKPG